MQEADEQSEGKLCVRGAEEQSWSAPPVCMLILSNDGLSRVYLSDAVNVVGACWRLAIQLTGEYTVGLSPSNSCL